VLYTNSDIFNQNSIALVPKTWDEFLEISQKLTKKDVNGNITLAGAALGRAQNIRHAPLILETFFLQSGEKIIDSNGEVVLGNVVALGGADLRPAESSLRFISDFANPRKTSQSWSGTLPEAKEAFIAGKLAMYLGLIREFEEIKNKNPHLAFSVSLLPQLSGASRAITSGTLYALVVPKVSAKQKQAWEFISFLANAENASFFAGATKNVSLRRAAIKNYQKEAVRSVFADSALNLKLWPNPDPMLTDSIFRELIENVSSGRETLRDALEKVAGKLSEI